MSDSNHNQTSSHISLHTHISDTQNAQSFTSYPTATASYEDVLQSSDLFWEKLKDFHKSLGTKFVVPTMAGRSLDLHHLFVEVTSRGGIEQVISNRRWKEVVATFSFPSTITSASFKLRNYYLSLLYHFEQVYLFHKKVPTQKDAMDGILANGSSSKGEISTVDEFPASPDLQFGCRVTGTIDAKFDNGYLVTVQLGANQLKGVLYHIPQGFQVSQSSNPSDFSTPRHRKRSQDVLHDRPRPKSHRSGYNFFYAEQFAKLNSSHHGQAKLLSKQIAELWNNLKEEEKQVYQDKGLKDLERYRAEMSEYRSSFTQ